MDWVSFWVGFVASGAISTTALLVSWFREIHLTMRELNDPRK